MSPLTPRRARRLLVVLLLVLGLVLPVSVAGAANDPSPSSLSEARRKREEVRRQRAQVASQIDTLKASNRELEAALDDLEDNLRTQRALLADAQRAAVAAEERVGQAKAVEAAKQEELRGLEQQLKSLAVEAYVSPPQDDALVVLDSGDITTAVRKQAMLSFRAGRVVDVMDEAAQVEEDLAAARREAEAAAAEAMDRRAEEQERLGQVEEALDEQEALADKVDARLDRALGEAQALASIDAKLAASIEKQQAELAARAARARAEAEARARAARASRPRSGGGGGGSSSSSVSAPVSAGGVTSVRGITVHTSIAGNVAALIDAAAADGIHLTGGGYRDSSAQIAVRRRNCGSSHHAIYQASPSSCRPPTARPGSSMHERGLAIDFTCNGGGVISSRSSPCFKWLAANASRFGLYNLPSEPWHWSTNGQ